MGFFVSYRDLYFKSATMMNLSKPFSQSSEENKQVIFDAIPDLLIDKKTLLEIASGTGQHAIFFSQKLPALTCKHPILSPPFRVLHNG